MEQVKKVYVEKRIDGDLIRVDKDFALNGFHTGESSTFLENLKDDPKEYQKSLVLLKNFIVFLNKVQQRDLFGSQLFDPYDLAHEMGYPRSYLFQTIKNPLVIDGVKFSTRLENILANCLTHLLLLIHNDYNQKTKKVEKTFLPIKILDSLKVITDPKNPKAKKRYLISCSPDSYRTINSYFARIDVAAFVSLRADYAQDLYTYIVAKRDNMIYQNKEVDTLYFPELCEKAGINYKTPARNKLELKKKMDIILSKDPTIGITFNFIHNRKSENSRWPYTPEIRLTDIQPISDFWDRKILETLIQLRNAYQRTLGTKQLEEPRFIAWIKSLCNNDPDIIIDKYLHAVDTCSAGKHMPERDSEEVGKCLQLFKVAPSEFFRTPTLRTYKALKLIV